MQPLQYISDYTGKHTAVVIPIYEWEYLVKKYVDLEMLEQKLPLEGSTSGQRTMGDFYGMLTKDEAQALLKHVEQSRNEWDRSS